MTLTSRLSLFFLATLAVVLAGFSIAVYVLAQSFLHRQAEERLEAALNTLVAAAEQEPAGLEWEPQGRQLPGSMDAEPVPWLVTDGEGRWVDSTRHLFSKEILTDSPLALFAAGQANEIVYWRQQPWLVGARRLEANRNSVAAAEQGKQYHRFLVVTAGVPLQPARATLRNLAFILAGSSAGVWLLACVAGRSLSRRALLPLTRMAQAVRGIDPADLSERLPIPGTRDELADLGRAFNDLLARAHESFARQRRFTGDASHQLRTPLTAILGQLEVALRRPRSVEEYQQVLASVERQALHLRALVDMLLFLARADAEARAPLLESIDLAGWLRQHMTTIAADARAADVHVEYAVDRAVPVLAQPLLLGQLVDNLLDNARKYSDPGMPITVRVDSANGVASLSVADRGCGISAEDLPHVFEPFYRSAQARRLGQGGVGLGLAIARRIAGALDGEIVVSSEPGKGSCFSLRLPQAPQPQRPACADDPRRLTT
jgi:heavy metal sensor kinase